MEVSDEEFKPAHSNTRSAYPPPGTRFYAQRESGAVSITFRCVLLSCVAAETLAVRYVSEPLPFEEERLALHSLLAQLCEGGADSATALCDGLLALAQAGGDARTRMEAQALAEQAVAALKLHPAEEESREAAQR
jgi:hypothetical protein